MRSWVPSFASQGFGTAGAKGAGGRSWPPCTRLHTPRRWLLVSGGRAVFGAALGLVDVMLAGDRARAARVAPSLGGLTIVPSLGRDHGGILIGGRL